MVELRLNDKHYAFYESEEAAQKVVQDRIASGHSASEFTITPTKQFQIFCNGCLYDTADTEASASSIVAVGLSQMTNMPGRFTDAQKASWWKIVDTQASST